MLSGASIALRFRPCVWSGYGRGWLPAASVALTLFCVRPCDADFAPLVRVSDAGGHATQAATGIDVANNAYIAIVAEERITLKGIGPGFAVNVPIPAGGLGQGDPDLATNTSGHTYLSFSQLDEDAAPGEGREIYYTRNPGSGFQTPINISRSRADDSASRLTLDFHGKPHITWVQRVQEETPDGTQEGTQVMYWHYGMGEDEPALVVAKGDYPAIFVDSKDVVHLVYSRANDLWYNNNAGGQFSNARRATTTPFEPESGAAIAGDLPGNVVISYESRSTLYYVTRTVAGAFRPS
jgi:hypothetical protein